jgi:hypothetical protein
MVALGEEFPMLEHLAQLPQGAQLLALATVLMALMKPTTSCLTSTTPQLQQWVLAGAAGLLVILRALLQQVTAATVAKVQAVAVVVQALMALIPALAVQVAMVLFL